VEEERTRGMEEARARARGRVHRLEHRRGMSGAEWRGVAWHGMARLDPAW